MTLERQEENKLKKGERVVMHTCIESEEHPGKIWTCKTDQFTRGTGVYEQDSVFLEGYSGSFAPEFLQKVMLPSEDATLLAALEEAEQQLDEIKLKSHSKIYTQTVQIQTGLERIKTLFNELAEAQQTIARQRGALEEIEEEMVDDFSARAQKINQILNVALGNKESEVQP